MEMSNFEIILEQIRARAAEKGSEFEAQCKQFGLIDFFYKALMLMGEKLFKANEFYRQGRLGDEVAIPLLDAGVLVGLALLEIEARRQEERQKKIIPLTSQN